MHNIVVICTSFHKEYIERMLTKVQKTVEKLEEIDIFGVYWVPGALEIPYAIRKIEAEYKSNIDGYVVLGIIEKGETDHGLVMGQTVIKHLIKFQTKKFKPVGIGIIGPGAEPNQIKDRIEMHAENAIMAVEHLLKGPDEWK